VAIKSFRAVWYCCDAIGYQHVRSGLCFPVINAQVKREKHNKKHYQGKGRPLNNLRVDHIATILAYD